MMFGFSFVGKEPHRLRHLSFVRRGSSTEFSEEQPLSTGAVPLLSKERLGEVSTEFSIEQPPSTGAVPLLTKERLGEVSGFPKGQPSSARSVPLLTKERLGEVSSSNYRQSWMRAIAPLLLAFCLLMSWATPAQANGIDQTHIDEATQLWQTSAHALNEINCSSCHETSDTNEFVARPGIESCQTCHQQDVDTFLLGQHGIRLLEGDPPLTPAMARLPMQPDAMTLQMTCNSCHDVHSVNTVQAAVDSCLTCHSDTHSLNYENSRHAELFAADRTLPRPSATSVSCATCHLPRHQTGTGDNVFTLVNHNNTYTLLPRDRMVKDVCMNCHGMEYSYNSIFDDDLVEANFDAPPSLALETFDLVRAFEERRTDQGDG